MLISHVCLCCCVFFSWQETTDTKVNQYFSFATGGEDFTIGETTYVVVDWNETYFLPCSPRPFWPYSSALQHHKWRHPVSCREIRKRENYNKEMEITDLELNDRTCRSCTKWQVMDSLSLGFGYWQSKTKDETKRWSFAITTTTTIQQLHSEMWVKYNHSPFFMFV